MLIENLPQIIESLLSYVGSIQALAMSIEPVVHTILEAIESLQGDDEIIQ